MSNRKYKRILFIKVPMTIYVFFFVQVFNQIKISNAIFHFQLESIRIDIYSTREKENEQPSH
jgi:hypothetical protein